MSRPILADAERIDALENKCSLLAVSLRQAEVEGVQKERQAVIIATDCAAIFSEHSEWHLALFQSILKFTDQGEHASNDLDLGERITVTGLARIGAYLADSGFGTAHSFKTKAEEVTA